MDVNSLWQMNKQEKMEEFCYDGVRLSRLDGMTQNVMIRVVLI